MADVRRKGGFFTGRYADGPGYEGPIRHHPMHSCLNFILRVLTALATAAAVVVTLKSNQSYRSLSGYSKARWRDFPALKWFIIANAVVFVYAVIAGIIAFFSICIRRGPLSYTASAFLTFLADFLLASALISAAAAALAVAWIGKHGQSTAGWSATCGTVDKFCNYIQGAIIASFCGWVFLALSTLLAVSALHHLGRGRL
jgi:uncharacterized protein (TIGR01569 family)